MAYLKLKQKAGILVMFLGYAQKLGFFYKLYSLDVEAYVRRRLSYCYQFLWCTIVYNNFHSF